jgi:ArsR family transcriptional regulator
MVDTVPAWCTRLATDPMDEQAAADLARVFKALSDPVRLRLLSLIAARAGAEVCVCELAGEFEVTAPTISFHLRVLREAGLVVAQRRGTWVYYRVVPETFTQLSDFFEATRLVLA